jgi:hypothetical protein
MHRIAYCGIYDGGRSSDSMLNKMTSRLLLSVSIAWNTVLPVTAQTITGNNPTASSSIVGTVPNTHPGFVANNWYQPYGYPAPAGSPLTPGANKIVCGYGTLWYPVTLSAIGANVVTNDAGKRFQFAIYSDGAWGRPSALVTSTPDITLAGTGVVNGAVSQAIPAGGYWFCENTESASAVITTGAGGTAGVSYTATIGSASQTSIIGATIGLTGISVAQTYGTWPASFASSQSWTEVQTAIVPILVIKVATSP